MQCTEKGHKVVSARVSHNPGATFVFEAALL